MRYNLRVFSVSSVVLFAYSIFCYIATLGALVYFMVFCSGLYEPISVNSQVARYDWLTALAINICLLSVFGVQHSVMARQSFKSWLARFLPVSVERSTYCLASACVLALIPFAWVPIEGIVWELNSPILSLAVQVGSVVGWTILLVATFQIGHFELFGLKQTYYTMQGEIVPASTFKTPGLYRIVRHPIQLGVLMGMWLVPTSTSSHLMLSLGMTVYVLVGLYFEERDLVREYGNRYQDYRQRIAKLIPFIV